jgi:hypothetical protein
MEVAAEGALAAARALLQPPQLRPTKPRLQPEPEPEPEPRASPAACAQRAAAELHAALEGQPEEERAAVAARHRGARADLLVVELAGAVAPTAGAERGVLAAPAGARAALALLASLTRLLLAPPGRAEPGGRRLAKARHAAARSVCAALPYFKAAWPWSDVELQSEAAALVAAVGRALLCLAGTTRAAEQAALSAAVFGDQLGEVAGGLQRLPVAAASAASCQVVRLATADTIGEAMCLVPMMVPTIESSEWSLKLDGLLSVHHMVHAAKSAELNWRREDLTALLLRALVFWEEDALSLSVPAAVRALTAIHALHGGASSPEGAASLAACERLAAELIRALGLVESDAQRQVILDGLGGMVQSTHLMMTQFLPVSRAAEVATTDPLR